MTESSQSLRFPNRREVLRTALAGAAGVALGAPVLGASPLWPQAPGTETVELGRGLFLLRVPGEANVLAQLSDGGVLLVDGASRAGSDALMRAVDGLAGAGPVRTIFNTHWHAEQTGSNERLGRDGARIIAHENTRLWTTTDVTWPWDGHRFDPLPKVAQPNHTFYGTGELASGVRYGYIPDAAHTDGDLYVYFPEQNVLAVGDTVSGDGWPLVDWWTGGWIGGIVGGLQRLQALADTETRVIPARGRVLGLADLEEQSEMYGTIYDRLSRLLNSGRGPTEAVEARPTAEYDDRMGSSDEFVRRAFESLWAYVTPDA